MPSKEGVELDEFKKACASTSLRNIGMMNWYVSVPSETMMRFS